MPSSSLPHAARFWIAQNTRFLPGVLCFEGERMVVREPLKELACRFWQNRQPKKHLEILVFSRS